MMSRVELEAVSTKNIMEMTKAISFLGLRDQLVLDHP